MRVLFVGGELDGEVLECKVPLLPEMRMPAREKISKYPTRTDRHVFRCISYALQTFWDADGSKLFVYMHGDVAGPLRTLIQSYVNMATELKNLEKCK